MMSMRVTDPTGPSSNALFPKYYQLFTLHRIVFLPLGPQFESLNGHSTLQTAITGFLRQGQTQRHNAVYRHFSRHLFTGTGWLQHLRPRTWRPQALAGVRVMAQDVHHAVPPSGVCIITNSRTITRTPSTARSLSTPRLHWSSSASPPASTRWIP